jgi:outer membrane protein assembly factor BamB
MSMLQRLQMVALATGIVAGWAYGVPAEDWPGWRGPRGDGTSLDRGVPTRWSKTENIAWKTPIAHGGHGSPIVRDGTVFLVGTRSEDEMRVLMSFSLETGKML